MAEAKRRLPIGIQSFQKLREERFVYVDKTRYIHQLAEDSVQYFLRRPRRFGKRLLLSTLRAYWEGKKELFKGLAIEKQEAENPDAWKAYPVFYFDLNGRTYPNTLRTTQNRKKADLAIIFKSPFRHYDRSGLRLFQIK